MTGKDTKSNTKEDILQAALGLFAESGFDAVSTSRIAAKLGITKGALYRHFKSKRDIFDSIIARMYELDAQQAEKNRVPEKTYGEDGDAYKTAAFSDLCGFVCDQFLFWTENGFARQFRRMITVEQFKSLEMNKLYQDVIALGPVRYTEDLFGEMLKNGQLNEKAKAMGAKNLAIRLFAPLQLSLQFFDGGENPENVLKSLREITSDFEKEYMTEKNTENINIRLEREEDYRRVENLVRESFWNVYRPGCLEHFVLKCLRADPDFIRELDFVMERNGELIGQNVFVRTALACDGGTRLPILTMGPICIKNEYKRQGYGKRLLDYSLEKAKDLGYGAVMFEGNILFYGQSGFTYASRFGIRYHGLPEGEDASFFLCKELIPGYLKGVTGEYATPKGYFVCEENPEAFEAYESGFPPKEKLKLPGQLGS